MVVRDLAKVETRVRFPLDAPMSDEEKTTEEKLLTPAEFVAEVKKLNDQIKKNDGGSIHYEGPIEDLYSLCYDWLNKGFWAGRFKEADEAFKMATELELGIWALVPLISYSFVAYEEDPKRLEGRKDLVKKNRTKLIPTFSEREIDAAVA